MALFVTIRIYEGELNTFNVGEEDEVELEHELILWVHPQRKNGMRKPFPFDIGYIIGLLVFFGILGTEDRAVKIIFFCLGI